MLPVEKTKTRLRSRAGFATYRQNPTYPSEFLLGKDDFMRNCDTMSLKRATDNETQAQYHDLGLHYLHLGRG